MKKKGTKNLTFTQRLMLEDCLRAKLHKKIIAKKLGVCLATVYNEIKRGEYTHKEHYFNSYWGERQYKFVKRYSPNLAEDKYRMNMTAKGAPLKIGNDFDFVRYVEKRVLKDKLSPCAVLGEIKRKQLFKTNISKTTLYRYISVGIFMNLTMQDLPMYKRKKRYRKAVAKRSPRGSSIEQRPIEISKRNSFGHWEMDCVCGKNKAALLVLSERLTRKEIIFLMPNKKTESVVRCIDNLELRYGKNFNKVFRSITVDNGMEFSDVQGLERSINGGKRISIYYCHPFSSCERGTNERLNRDIRRLLPKGTSFKNYSPAEIQAVEDWVNAYPREIFGFESATDRFNQQLANL